MDNKDTKTKPILIHEVHDMWPATLVELGGMSKKHPFVQLLQKAENDAYSKSDFVVSILSEAEEYMIEHGLEKGKFVHIPNGIVMEEWSQSLPLPDAISSSLDRLKESGKYIVGYFGGHALSNGLDVLLDAAKMLCRESSIHIVLVGNGAEKERLVKRNEVEQIGNISFFDAVDRRCVPNLLDKFDCIYMGTIDSALYRFGLGLNKFYDAMMSGKPVILSTNAPNTVIEKHNCGVVVPAEDVCEIEKAILDVYRMNKEELDIIKKKSREAVETYYTYDKLADKFTEVWGAGECKNILYIEHYAGTPSMGMEYRPYYLAKEWVKKGHHVDIIAADYSHLRINNPIIEKDWETKEVDGIHYHWIHTIKYEGNGIKRAITMFQFVAKIIIRAKKIVKKYRPDIVITSSTYPLDTYAGQLLRKYSGLFL